MPPEESVSLSTSSRGRPSGSLDSDPREASARVAKKRTSKQNSVREWSDAIIIAFLLAMFIRVFVVELFKIPSPSMTPTLLGTHPSHQAISFYDVNDNGLEDMLLASRSRNALSVSVFLRKNRHYEYAGEYAPGYSYDLWMRKIQQRQDRIIVGKFFYWFRTPNRGDIVVFKVPEVIFRPDKPIYIKRVAGLPGERLTFEPAPGVPGHEHSMGWLVVDGERVMEPEFFQRQLYEYLSIPGVVPADTHAEATYSFHGRSADLHEARVPENSLYVFGDYTVSSQDSRYWGPVELDRLRGRAIFRYYKSPQFLR